MANQIVVLALIFVAIVGYASAQAPTTTPTTSKGAAAPAADAATTTPSGSGAALTPGSDAGALSPTEGSASSPDSSIGNTDDIGASVPAPAPSSKKSGASSLGFSAVTGAAAVAGYFLF